MSSTSSILLRADCVLFRHGHRMQFLDLHLVLESVSIKLQDEVRGCVLMSLSSVHLKVVPIQPLFADPQGSSSPQGDLLVVDHAFAQLNVPVFRLSLSPGLLPLNFTIQLLSLSFCAFPVLFAGGFVQRVAPFCVLSFVGGPFLEPASS